MKTILLIIICIVSSITVSAQRVQDSFFGISFGTYMYHMEKAMNENGYLNKRENNDLLEAQDVRFGGYNWKFVSFYYIDNQFYRISFSNHYKTKSEALKRFVSLKESLKKKYEGIYWENVNDLGIKGLVINDNSRSLFLDLIYSRSQGGDMFYYVDLSYYHNYLWDKSINKDEEDL